MGREGGRQAARASPFYYSKIGGFTLAVLISQPIRKKLVMLEHHPGNYL
jgi:hypothetical protein